MEFRPYYLVPFKLGCLLPSRVPSHYSGYERLYMYVIHDCDTKFDHHVSLYVPLTKEQLKRLLKQRPKVIFSLRLSMIFLNFLAYLFKPDLDLSSFSSD